MLDTKKTSAEQELVSIAVSGITFLSAREKLLLYNSIASVDEMSKMSVNDISNVVGRKVLSRSWDGNSIPASARRSRAIMHTFDIKYVTVMSENYPDGLQNIADKPFSIFYRGNFDILKNPCVGVVGSRLLTPDGRRETIDFSKSAADKGFTVVSGLASGVDSAAHVGALKSDSGRTVAVLPSGIDTIVPAGNKSIAAAIIKRGCLLSEYPPGTPPLNWRFVQRNRIIAGLSSDIVIVQAPPASGSLITADFAIDYGRELYVLKSSFEKKALSVAMMKKNKIEAAKVAGTRKYTRKVKSICEYISEDGVPVIDDFNDFLKCKLEAPGERFFDVSEFIKFFEI